MPSIGRAGFAFILTIVSAGFSLAPRSADGRIMDMVLGSKNPSFTYLFPNWRDKFVTSFDFWCCEYSICPTEPEGDLAGVTIVNYGTAVGGANGDITDMYFHVFCSAWGDSSIELMTMTYAGIWLVGGESRPAWTWESNPTYMFADDPCDKDCTDDCIFAMNIIINIGPCPTEGATVQLGPNFDETLAFPGGISDQYGATAPWESFHDPIAKTIVYSLKEVDKGSAAPGDTLTYKITYGLPGTAPLSEIVIFDSLPPYTHYLAGTGVPAPDPGWAPNPGTPQRLKWTLPGPVPVANGPTNVVSFQASIDWGNGDDFEPGSGNVAAPEGSRLQNSTQVFFVGTTCPQTSSMTNSLATTVRRYLLWKVADNDLLFSPSLGQPLDEAIFSIYIKNMSATKTWWGVRLWDTVPDTLDSWAPGCGIDDVCVGWTMTPTGCALGSPGRVVTAGATLLTWVFDMPPGMTMEVRWKAQVKPTTAAGEPSISVVTLKDQGNPGVLGGTGPSSTPKKFAHDAKIVLPTTYVSYVAFGGRWIESPEEYFLAFYPLHKKTQFELRSLEYFGKGTFADVGGVSASIGCYIGDCLGGFPGSAANCPLAPIPGGGNPGCTAQRIPAMYYREAVTVEPFNFIYKVVSNAPMCWQVLIDDDRDCADHMTFAPATNMSYTGLIHYFIRRTETKDQLTGMGDSLVFANTGKTVYGEYDPAQATTVHLFRFDYLTSQWIYMKSYEIDGDSLVFDDHTFTADEGMWRSISSDAQLVVVHGYNWHISTSCCCSCCGYNAMAIWPSRELGNVIIREGDTAYGPVTDAVKNNPGDPKVVIGNVGDQDATYEVQRYQPHPSFPSILGVPDGLRGNSGSWLPPMVRVLPAGINHPANPYAYPRDGGEFKSGTTAFFRVRLISGGPLQIIGNINVFTHWGGGGVLHAAKPIGSQSGVEFWLHHTYNYESNDKCDGDSTYTMDIFCPKTGMSARAQSELGMDSTYTTTGPDQCIAFMAFTQPAGTGKTNYKFTVSPTGSHAIAAYMQCAFEKGFTAPFLATGVHYMIIAPPVVFAGQNFWITVVVVDASNATKEDYCGTTSFTSTDPAAVIESVPMDSFDYVWSNDIIPCGAGSDNGVKLFINVTLLRPGVQTIVAVDSFDGSITGVVNMLVAAADVKLFKEPPLSVVSSGDIVQFKICWSNYSNATALRFEITDKIPDGTVYLPDPVTSALCGATLPVNVYMAYSALVTPIMPGPKEWTTMTTGTPPANATWLRWTIDSTGVKTTGCVCFRVSVN